MSAKPRTAGFRMSLVDGLVLFAAPCCTWLTWPLLGPMAGIFSMAVGHFFLFCNMFRIRRSKELLWAAVCLINVGAWATIDPLSWLGILSVQSPFTVALIGLELRSPMYHGIGAARINPRLPEYLAGRI